MPCSRCRDAAGDPCNVARAERGVSSDKKVSSALTLSTKEIETVSELEEVHDRGRLDQLGFMPFTLGRIEDALKGALAPQPRRTHAGSRARLFAGLLSATRLKALYSVATSQPE